MTDITNRKRAEELLSALGEQLAAAGYECELVVIGGSGLLALGAIDRATRDVDLLALRAGDELRAPQPLPPELLAAAVEPTEEELSAAARRSRTHDPSDGFRSELQLVLAHLGVEGVDLGA